jgi:hypothetical protein
LIFRGTVPLAWKQVDGVRDDTYAALLTLIQQDIDWDRKRSGILTYLLLAYGVAAITGFQLLFAEAGNHPESSLRAALIVAVKRVAFGLIVTCVAYGFDLVAHWLSMRNRKAILASGSYRITKAETAASILSAVLAVAAAIYFAIIFYRLFAAF